MDLGLNGKIALVTGGSRGIGRAAALALAEAGAEVAISYASNEAAAAETVAAIQAKGQRARAWRFDVADLEATHKTVGEIAKAHGGLHVLVANAGIAVDGLAMRFKDEDLEKVFRTNVFGASKSAMDGMARSLARELASRNITCNVVAPGFIETDMTATIPEEARKKLVEQIPAGEIGKAEDIAAAVAFLASDRARYITGQVIEVNGGLHM
jgi:3-oxoacyl-[acyl-carrier protein] reductase